MLPNAIPHYSVGPFVGLIAHVMMAILCLVVMALYTHYRPLRSLFLFYCLSASLFLGWTIYGFQKSPESILLGYRIDLAALALLPASWAGFTSSLADVKLNRFSRVLMGVSLILCGLALFGKGTLFLSLPLQPHEVTHEILRPQSKFLRPLIHFFALTMGVYYGVTTSKALLKKEGPPYLLPFLAGMILWLFGGCHDALRSYGISILFQGQILWFTSIWLSIFLTLAVALHFRSLDLAIREARDVFEKFVPPPYLRRIASRGLGSIRLGEADQQWVSILCCDIRGFTTLSEQLPPVQLIALVNQIYDEMVHPINAKQGVIDKFLGDAVLCIFEGDHSAERAVDCGVEILTVVHHFNERNRFTGDRSIQIGIGVHFGQVILGTIGSSERMDSTVLGLTVNLAKRLEELTRTLKVSMLISKEVAGQLPEGYLPRLRPMGEVTVKGHSTPLTVYEVIGNTKGFKQSEQTEF